MKFSPRQLNEFVDIIRLNHVIYIAEIVGVDSLSPDDKKILKKYGMSDETLTTPFTETEQAFYWGRLSQALRNKAHKVNYNDFTEYLRRGQYIPLSKTEESALKYIKNNTYNHIKGLGDKIAQDVNGIVIKNDPDLRASYEEVIRSSLERGVIERNSLKSIVSEIGHRTEDWSRNLGRIVDTEMQNAFQIGRAEQIKREKGADSTVYKDVYSGACHKCIELYLTGGIGSQPRLFRLNDLVANGNNYGLKQKDWKATLGPVHPYCRCNLHQLPDGYVWDEEKQMFSPPPYEPTGEKLGYKITVGDKVIEV